MEDADFVAHAYRGLLGREPDATGLANWTAHLRMNTAAQVLAGMVASEEFRRNYIFRQIGSGDHDKLATFSNLLASAVWNRPIHQLRCQLVGQLLPQARQILDLGGASSEPEGALIHMGYRGAEQITIIDLPPDIRFKKAMEGTSAGTYQGIKVAYAYHSMADLRQYADDLFDLIWSGQTIEHVTREDGEAIFSEIPRILKPGGIFALDTPNRTATQLWKIRHFIHAEHKYEYKFRELTEALTSVGLEQVDCKGIIDVSRSLKVGYLIPDEFTQGRINGSPETSFIFYVQYRKRT